MSIPTNPNILTIGFARRFATYKRAALLFQNPGWLREIISHADRPVLFLFAGKAHPADQPGQDIIRRIAEISKLPEFEGRILLIEGYDLNLARSLVSGVDVWLNNPIYPLEASGTSGMKAAINGALNLSVLDGWWGEGYDDGTETAKPANGWAIEPAAAHLDDAQRDAEEARTLYELLQDHVIPTYYQKGPAGYCPMGYSPAWVAMSKRSIATISPRFNMTRMVSEYVNKFYAPASAAGRRFAANNFAVAHDIAQWKSRSPLRLARRSPASPGHPGTPHAVWRLAAHRGRGPAQRTDRQGCHGRGAVRPPQPEKLHSPGPPLSAEILGQHRQWRSAVHAGTDAGTLRQAGIPHPRLSDPFVAYPPT